MIQPLKIVFAGTPEIAKNILSGILNSGFKVELVLTQPDARAFRGKKIVAPVVKNLALTHDIEVIQPEYLTNNQDVLNKIKNIAPDIIIVIAYGMLLPKEFLTIASCGAVNLHMSLLPRHRGAAPIQRTIIAGDLTSGVTLIQMDEGLDTGDILLQQELNLTPNETAGELYSRLTILAEKMIIDYLHHYKNIKAYPQAKMGVTYAHKIEKSEALINWQEEANIIARKVHGFNPKPGAFSFLDNNLIKFWRVGATTITTEVPAGSIIEANKDSLLIACGKNTVLTIFELQDAGKTRQETKEYLQGHQNLFGKMFG